MTAAQSQAQIESSLGFNPQKYVNTTVESKLFLADGYVEYFNNVGVCTCCADSIKGQQDKVLSYKYPRSVNTLYKKDYQTRQDMIQCGHGKQPQFIIDNEKRNLKVKFNPPFNNVSTKQADFQPFSIKQVEAEEEQKAKQVDPIFINSTTYGTNYANWGARPFERVKEIINRPFDSPFKSRSTYTNDFNKNENQRLPPDFEREFDDKFYKEMRARNQKGEFAGLL